MGHGSDHPLILYAHIMFAFYGVVFNDIFFSQWTFTAKIYSYLSIDFFFIHRLGYKRGIRYAYAKLFGGKSGYGGI